MLSEVQRPSEFAGESDLRNILAMNLSRIEPDLQLYPDEGVTGVEFPVRVPCVGILALDANNRFVVIVLKVSRGYDRVMGQLLRYMAWIEKHHAELGEGVRGIIVSREIADDLRLTCSCLRNVSFFEYERSVSWDQVSVEAIG